MTAVKPAWLSVEFVPDLVSIIVPAHNRRELLRRALSSVVRQNYAPIECIVVDDGSTENTREVVEEAKSSSGSRAAFRYIRQDQAGGCAARNRGLKESRGEFIAFLDSDDELLPEALQRKVERLKSSPVPYCYDRGQRVDENGNELGFFGQEWPSDGGPVIWRYLFDTNAPLLRRSVCVQVGPWNESLQGNQEVEYFARVIIRAGRGEFVPEVGHKVFEHGGPRIVGTDSHKQSTLQVLELILLHLLREGTNFVADREIYSRFVREMFSVAANVSYRDGNHHAAFDNLGKAYRYGYRRWHVGLYLRLFPIWPRAVSHAYFLLKRVCARFAGQRRLPRRSSGNVLPGPMRVA